MAAGRYGGCAAGAAVEALQGAELQKLVLLPYGGPQRLAGCAPASPFLYAWAAGPTALHCVQYSDKLCSPTGQTAPQASLQKHVLPHRDDLPAAGYHVSVLCVLGPITGKNFSSVELYS